MPIRSRIQSVVNAVTAKVHHLTDGGKLTLYAATTPLTAALRPADGVEIATRSALAELTDVERRALLTGSAGRVRRESAEFERRFARGAKWVCLSQHGEPACWLWAHLGAALPDWFVPLDPADVVIYGVFTRYDFRGTGLAPRLILAASNDLAGPGCRSVCGIADWNESSIRAFAKLGFTSFAQIQV